MLLWLAFMPGFSSHGCLNLVSETIFSLGTIFWQRYQLCCVGFWEEHRGRVQISYLVVCHINSLNARRTHNPKHYPIPDVSMFAYHPSIWSNYKIISEDIRALHHYNETFQIIKQPQSWATPLRWHANLPKASCHVSASRFSYLEC